LDLVAERNNTYNNAIPKSAMFCLKTYISTLEFINIYSTWHLPAGSRLWHHYHTDFETTPAHRNNNL